MKLPRGIPGTRVIRMLETLQYNVIREKGSHVRLRHQGPPAHSITVPKHGSLKIGTLHSILTEIAFMRSLTINELEKML